jgi:Na+/H+-dicarboxylate symporter
MCSNEQNIIIKSQKRWYRLIIYLTIIVSAIISGLSDISQLHQLGISISDITVKLFKALSLPLISLSLIVTITKYHTDITMKGLGRKVIIYTISTTIIAATTALIIYLIVKPEAPKLVGSTRDILSVTAEKGYLEHLDKIIPSNILEPFLSHNVFGVLLISLMFGITIRHIEDKTQQETVINFFSGLHKIFIILTKYLIRFIPIALFGFITVMAKDFKQGINFTAIGSYLLVVVLANLIQGVVVLPLWLWWHKIPIHAMVKGALPALSLAFFSKSSAATLPVTIECAENNLKVRKNIAHFVLPLCTTINMNGCAAFILATVIFVMQSQGIYLTPFVMVSWIIIATIAAIGNAGVPMGCFFLSASLLSNMGMDLVLLGIILPFYGIIDMIETSLNVWSDICVTKVADQTSK